MSEAVQMRGDSAPAITEMLNGAFGLDLGGESLSFAVTEAPMEEIGQIVPSGGGVNDIAAAAMDAVSDIQEAVVGISGKGEPYSMDAYNEGSLGQFSAPRFNTASAKQISYNVMSA